MIGKGLYPAIAFSSTSLFSLSSSRASRQLPCSSYHLLAFYHSLLHSTPLLLNYTTQVSTTPQTESTNETYQLSNRTPPLHLPTNPLRPSRTTLNFHLQPNRFQIRISFLPSNKHTRIQQSTDANIPFPQFNPQILRD